MTPRRAIRAAASLLTLLCLSAPHLSADEPGVDFTRGEQLFKAEKFEEAVSAFTAAVQADPHDDRAFVGRAMAHARLKQPALAGEDYARAIQAAPASDRPLLARGIALVVDGRYADGIRDLDAAARLNPDSLAVYHWRGFAYSRTEHSAQAIADFDEALRRDPGNKTFGGLDFFDRGVMEYVLGRTEEALADYERAEAAGYGCANERAGCLIDLKRWKDALPVLDAHLHSLGNSPESDGDRYAALCERALVRAGLQHFPAAEADLLLAMALDPDKAQAYGTASWIRLFARQPAAASAAALRGLELEPSQDWIRLNLGHAYLLEGRTDLARAIYLKDKDLPHSRGKTRGQSVLDDFADLRAAGVRLPDTSHLEELLRLPPGTPIPPEETPAPPAVQPSPGPAGSPSLVSRPEMT